MAGTQFGNSCIANSEGGKWLKERAMRRQWGGKRVVGGPSAALTGAIPRAWSESGVRKPGSCPAVQEGKRVKLGYVRFTLAKARQQLRALLWFGKSWNAVAVSTHLSVPSKFRTLRNAVGEGIRMEWSRAHC